jgi:integrase
MTKIKTKTKNVTFVSIVKHYMNNHIVSKEYESNVYRIAKRCKYISKDVVNNYLKDRLTKASSITVKSERTMLLTLWNYAYENNLVKFAPKNIVSIKARKTPTKAWTIDECKMLIDKSYEFDNISKRGVPLGCFIRAWLLLGYESGARFGDLLTFTIDNIDSNILRWTMSKTGDPMTKVLSSACVDSINELLSYKSSDDNKILGWLCGKRRAQIIMYDFLKFCNIKGSSKFLRRSGATHIEINQPGMAKFHLGHRSSGLAEKSYIDYGQITTRIPQTPKLVS